MTVSFYTLGCKVNQYETEAVAERFREQGHSVVSFSDPCDAVIINTCAVTEESSAKSRRILRRARRAHPDAIIAAMGCMCQISDSPCDIPCADVVVGCSAKNEIVDLVEKYALDHEKKISVCDILSAENFEPMHVRRGDHTRAQIKVEDGCCNFCSYCIIPYARGPVRSKSIEDAYEEALTLAANGYREIVITGIHLDSFGVDRGGCELISLLRRIDSVSGLDRIRLGSLEPVFITDDNLDGLIGISKLCPQFHLSLQSGSADTLRRMNRHYTPREYAEAVSKLRAAYPDCAVTTDVIVGFPGESDEEFEESLDFVRSMSFAKTHVFPFSARRGTAAFSMSGQIPPYVKKLRAAQMSQTAARGEAEFYESMLGRTVDVLFESSEDGVFYGHSANYAKVAVNSDADIRNKILPIYIYKAEAGLCYGRAAGRAK